MDKVRDLLRLALSVTLNLYQARENEQYHKKLTIEARAQRRAANQENEGLRAQLSRAEHSLKAHEDEVHRLQALIEGSQAHIKKMQDDESGFHDQILHDQEQLGLLVRLLVDWAKCYIHAVFV